MCAFTYVTAGYGVLWGLVASFWDKPFGRKLQLVCLTITRSVFMSALPLGFDEGWLTAALAAVVWSAMGLVAFLVIALSGHTLVQAVIALAKFRIWRQIRRGFVVAGKWFIATDAAKQR